ncbi:helix-turn-helix domain-containing protein [Qipengyuania sp. MTN3-11]|uniref:helix-turn-helix domain-containing protein n=1 Tax=Qipengyuania sp. MTN3-11 TaxID=3056557 RepID=UPI0036F30765
MNGLAHARKAGKHIGHKRALTPLQRSEIIERVENGQCYRAQLASLFRVSRSTVQRVHREHRAKEHRYEIGLQSWSRCFGEHSANGLLIERTGFRYR